MTILLAIILVLAGGSTVFFIVKGFVDVIRTYIRGRRAGIIRVCIKPSAWIVSSVVLCIMAILAGFSFNSASDAQKSVSDWEKMRGAEYTEYYEEYYNEMLSRYSGTGITDFDKFVDEQIFVYQSRSDQYISAGITVLLLALVLLTMVLDKIFYLTESGIIVRILKQPEEFFVKRRENMLDVYFKAPSDRTKPLISFKSTPDNLAKLGRFIEWEEEAKADIGTESL